MLRDQSSLTLGLSVQGLCVVAATLVLGCTEEPGAPAPPSSVHTSCGFTPTTTAQPPDGDCETGAVFCDADHRRFLCEEDAWQLVEQCDAAAGLQCSRLGCFDLCARAAEERSYTGCEYWPTITSNSLLVDKPEFDFAVVVSNPQLVAVDVEVSRGADSVTSQRIAPGSLAVIRLPVISELYDGADASVQVVSGAYRLRSSAPVTVQQLNPLDYRLNVNCDQEDFDPADGRCFSYSNDASLLLPTSVLTDNYIAVTRPTWGFDTPTGFAGRPGFISIIGVGDEPVDVEVTPSAAVVGSEDGVIPAMVAGETYRLQLPSGSVAQLVSALPPECPPDLVRATVPEMTGGVVGNYCELGRDYDLTGTVIRASGPVAVINGHDCTFIPYDRWACDHLEESALPVQSWGQEVVVADPSTVTTHPSRVRIVSAVDDNVVAFQPVRVSASVTLQRGEFAEFELREPVQIRGTGPLSVVQFLTGQGDVDGDGDPAMAVVAPREQWRSNYPFLSPTSYPRHVLAITAPVDVDVCIDGRTVGNWRPIGDTGMATTIVPVSSGVHRATSDQPFGLMMLGFGQYTSYMLPAGLDFRLIAAPI